MAVNERFTVDLNEDQRRDIERKIDDETVKNGTVELDAIHEQLDGSYRVFYSYDQPSGALGRSSDYVRFELVPHGVQDFRIE